MSSKEAQKWFKKTLKEGIEKDKEILEALAEANHKEFEKVCENNNSYLHIRKISYEDAKREIKDYLNSHDGEIYISEIITDLRIDLKTVLSVLEDLGHFKVTTKEDFLMMIERL